MQQNPRCVHAIWELRRYTTFCFIARCGCDSDPASGILATGITDGGTHNFLLVDGLDQAKMEKKDLEA